MPNTRDYALVVGVSHYRALNRLDGPINDARDFEQWLLSPTGGDLPRSNCLVIESSDNPVRPLQDDIDDRLNEIYTLGKETGFRRFYFYFAGHGMGIAWNENALCLPKWSDMLRNYALSSSEYLRTIMESGLFQEVFFFLDCCRNRKIGVKPAHPYLGWPKPGSGTAGAMSFVAYATEFDNAAYESEQWTEETIDVRGHFTKALIAGLKGAAINQQGIITTTSIKGFLKKQVEKLAQAEQHRQSVRFEDTFTTEGIIARGFTAPVVAVTLHLTQPGEILLFDPMLTLIRQEDSSTGPWQFDLPKGTYTLESKATGRTEYFRIDGTTTSFSYAF